VGKGRISPQKESGQDRREAEATEGRRGMRQREIDKLNRETEARWRSRFDNMPAKVGTVPMNIWVTHEVAEAFTNGTLPIGLRINFYEDENGQRCGGIVRKLKPILFVDRM
jgi:hypothetical protein